MNTLPGCCVALVFICLSFTRSLDLRDRRRGRAADLLPAGGQRWQGQIRTLVQAEPQNLGSRLILPLLVALVFVGLVAAGRGSVTGTGDSDEVCAGSGA